MSDPDIAAKEPIPVAVEEGKTYFWCTCGKSAKQPFCDGSHNAEGLFSPQAWTAPASKTVFFCACKRTAKQPLCDGSHTSL